jgi:Gpi18-like mannosyltransferase
MGTSRSLARDRRFVAVIGVLFLLFITVPLYRWFWPVVPRDATYSFIPWYQHIVAVGRLRAFSAPFGDYSPPYLYLMALATLLNGWMKPLLALKLLSLVIVGLMGGAFYKLLRVAQQPSGAAAGAAVMLFAVPSVIMNAVLLGQCDALSVAPCLLAVAAVVRRKPVLMLVWCGVAVAVKLQAIFIAPFALGALLSMNWRWWHFGVPALAYLGCVAPCLIMGWPLSDLLMIYFRQTQNFGIQMNFNAPNLWLPPVYFNWVNPPLDFRIAEGLAVLAGALVAWKTYLARAAPADVMALALVSAIAIPYVLPAVHERYFFLADILALGLFAVDRNLRSLAIALLVQIGSVCAIFSYVTGEATWALRANGQMSFALADPHNMKFGLTGFAAMTLGFALTIWRCAAVPNRRGVT